jgi:hypothetical protein
VPSRFHELSAAVAPIVPTYSGRPGSLKKVICVFSEPSGRIIQ